MKKAIHFPPYVLILSFLSCSHSEEILKASTIESSKTQDIELHQTVKLLFNRSSNGAVNWTATPSRGVDLESSGIEATAKFDEPGTYLLKASDIQTSAELTVSVDNEYTPCPGCQKVVVEEVNIADEEMEITPSIVDLGSNVFGSGPSLQLDIVSQKQFKDVSELNCNILARGPNRVVTINILGVSIYNNLHGSAEPGIARNITSYLYIPSGTSILQINHGGKSYSGSLHDTAAELVITWPYIKGITFTKDRIVKK